MRRAGPVRLARAARTHGVLGRQLGHSLAERGGPRRGVLHLGGDAKGLLAVPGMRVLCGGLIGGGLGEAHPQWPQRAGRAHCLIQRHCGLISRDLDRSKVSGSTQCLLVLTANRNTRG